MSEENQQRPLVAPPGWTEAMQGKVGNANRVKASKRVAVVLSLTFFGIFLWMYIIYSLGHPKKAHANSGEVPIAAQEAPVPVAQAGMPMAQSGMPMAAASPFGVPRGMEGGAMPAAGMAPMQAQSQMAPMQAQSPMAPNPYATAAYSPLAQGAMPGVAPNGVAPSGAALPPDPAMGAPMPMVPQNRGGVTISAPREFRHAVGVSGLGGSIPGMPTNASQRMRTVVSR